MEDEMQRQAALQQPVVQQGAAATPPIMDPTQILWAENQELKMRLARLEGRTEEQAKQLSDLSDMMERAIINTFVGRDVVEPGNYVQMFPYPCYTRDDFLFVIEHMMPLCMVISWVYSVAMMIQHIVAEKEHRLKEVMKMMGLDNAVHWVAWFITGFVQLSISVTALTAILKYGKVLMHSDVLIIWLFLAIYAVATIMFCFLVSVLYSKAKLASACGGIIYFLSYVPYMYVAIREEVAHDKITAFEKCIAERIN